MITINNLAQKLDTAIIPQIVQTDIKELKSLTNNFQNWNIYKDPTVKEWVDLVLKKINEANSPKQPKKKAQKPKITAKPKPKQKKSVKLNKKTSAKKIRKTTRKTLDVRSAPKTGVANQFIRRIAYCINRKVDARTIINLVEDIKLANIQLQSIKGTQHFQLIDRVYKQLVETVNNLPKDAGFVKIEVTDSLLKEIKLITNNRESEESRLKKAFVRLQGKDIAPIDAKRLLARIDKAVGAKKVSAEKFSAIKSSLIKIAEGGKKKIEADKSLAGVKKPATKFKVGQKVRHESGGIMTIKSIKGGVATCHDENSKVGVSIVSLKSLTPLSTKPKTSQLAKKFKVGDKVLHKPSGDIIKIERVYETKASYHDRSKIGGISLVPLVELQTVKPNTVKKK